MAITRTQYASANGNSTSPAVTLGAASANHATLIFIVHSRGTPSVTIPTNQHWKLVSRQTTTDGMMEMYYWNDAYPISTATFTLSVSKKWVAYMVEYAGALVFDSPPGQVYDGTVATATGTSVTAGASSSSTSTDSGDVFVTAWGCEGGYTFSAPTNSMTLVNQRTSSGGAAGTQNAVGFGERIPAATATYYSQATVSTSTNWAGIHVALKPAPAYTKAVKHFTYTGDGNSGDAFTGLGFQPHILCIFGESVVESDRTWRNNSMPATDSFASMTGFTNSGGDNAIDTIDADGFTLYATTLNTSSRIYHGLAIRKDDASTTIEYGAYVGTGADNRDITVGFQPDFVWVKRAVPGSHTFFRSSANVGDASMNAEATNVVADYIQAFGATTFQVGTTMNASGNLHYWVAFKEVTGGAEGGFQVGTYVGDASDDKDITVEVGHSPSLVFNLNGTNGYAGIWRAATMTGDLAGYFGPVGSAANIIQSFGANGFQVGTSQTENLSNYYYASWVSSLVTLVDSTPAASAKFLCLLGVGR